MASRLTTLIVLAIVAATLIAGLIVGAQRDDNSGPVDLIILNGKVYTADGSGRIAEAVAVRGNQILRVGTNREVKRLRRAHTRIVDAHGGTVLPGFNDARVDFIGWANSRALARAGIARRTPNPTNGLIVKDPRTGEPTGVLKDAAHELMTTVLPQPTRDDRRRALLAAIAEAHHMGVTSIQDISRSPDDIELYDEVRRAGELAVRVYAVLPIGPRTTDTDADALAAVIKRYPDDPLLKAGAVRLVVDGTIESRASSPPSTGPTSRRLNDRADVNRVIAMLDRRGWQIVIHAVDDLGVRLALDAYARAATTNPAPLRGRRHRIALDTIDPADVPRLSALGVIAALAPFRADPSENPFDVHPTRLEADPIWQAEASKRITEAGGRLMFGSGRPSAPLDPLLRISLAVDPPAPDGPPDGEPLPERRVPLPAVIDAYTSGAAYASFDDQRKGTLARGMLADIVILSHDILTTPVERLRDATVEVTIFEGKVVYTRDGSS